MPPFRSAWPGRRRSAAGRARSAAVTSLDLAVDVTARALADRGVDPSSLAQLVLGWTVPQPGIFYGAPTVAARLGAPALTGPMISQACATSVACLAAAAAAVDAGVDGPVLVVAADRTSNGPHLVYPQPDAPGAAPLAEDWVLDNFRRDPWAGESMVATAEAVAAEAGLTRAEIDETTLLRYEQYRHALADDRARQRAFMVPVERARPAPSRVLVEADSGVHETSAEKLAALAPLSPGGVVTVRLTDAPRRRGGRCDPRRGRDRAGSRPGPPPGRRLRSCRAGPHAEGTRSRRARRPGGMRARL